MSSQRIIINWQIFDRRDPVTGRYRCRNCGRPSVKPKRHYCSDECRTNYERALSWYSKRREAWNRDGRKCRKCSKPLKLYGTDHKCHHIIPVATLRQTAWDAVNEIEDHDRRYRQFEICYMLLYLDVQNLMPLCTKCHATVHRTMRMNKRGELIGDYTKYLRRWRAFLNLNAMGTQRLLSQYL